jgi:protoporphyrinogen oxidase
MRHVRFCILGAGPSGLAFAAALEQAQCDSFVVIEKQGEAGGLCRSAMVDGAPLDVGGGHFLDLRRPAVLDFLFRFLPRSEWREFARVSTIRLHGVEVEHPLEGNLWQLPLPHQVDYLESIARAGSAQGAPEPGTFDAWLRWKLGERIAEDYLLPYNRKLWSMPLARLAVDWIYKLPSVSLRESLQSCLERKSGGTLPAHGRFLYPRAHGYGEVWRRTAASLGDRLLSGYTVRAIDLDRRTVDDVVQADVIVSTIPWPEWTTLSPLPDAVHAAIDKLVYTSVHVDYRPENLPSRAHWIYEPNEDLAYHRQLLRHNFCGGAHGHWVETNARRSRDPEGQRFVNHYAYPVSTVDRATSIATVLDWARSRDVIGLGRWGTWEHINSDVAVERALAAARNGLVG